MELKGDGVSNKKKVIEEDVSDVLTKDNDSEWEEKLWKLYFYNEEKSDSYKRLEKFDGAGEGSKSIITEKINNDTSLDACKISPTLEVGKIQLLKAVHQVRML